MEPGEVSDVEGEDSCVLTGVEGASVASEIAVVVGLVVVVVVSTVVKAVVVVVTVLSGSEERPDAVLWTLNDLTQSTANSQGAVCRRMQSANKQT